MRKESFEQQLRRTLEGFEVEPEAEWWTDIESRLDDLDHTQRTVWQQGRVARLRRWWLRGAAAVLAFVVITATYMGIRKQQNGDNQLASTSKTAAKQSVNAVKSREIKGLGYNEISRSYPIHRSEDAQGNVAGQRLQRAEHTDVSLQTTEEPAQQAGVPSETAPQSSASSPDVKPSQQSREPIYIIGENLYAQEIARGRSAGRRLTATLYAGGSVGAASVEHTPVLMSKPILFDVNSPDNVTEAPSGRRTAPLFQADMEEQTRHRVPFVAGMQLGWELNERVTLQSGINYVRQESSFTQVVRQSQCSSLQTLTYVGIPLRVAYKIWKSRYLSVYTNAGGEVDANVKAVYRTEGMDVNISHDRPQLSADAAIGLEIGNKQGINLYMEPGVKYYFDNGSKTETYFKAHPLTFSMQVGLRFHLHAK